MNKGYYFLYLHGYQGSPNSIKGKKLQCWLQKACPDAKIDAPKLPATAGEALGVIHRHLDLADKGQKVIIGSSLGGYMAHLCKQIRNDVNKTILINPAIRLDLIADHLEYPALKKEAQQLLDLMPAKVDDLKDYLLLLQEDDQTTPPHFAIDAFQGARIDLKHGQGHHYDNIETSFDVIEDFLKLTAMRESNPRLSSNNCEK